jgi:hypothetical protein
MPSHSIPPPQSEIISDGITWLIFFDDLHLDFSNTGRLRPLLKVVAGELVTEGDVFTVRASGPSQIAIEPTSDRTRLDAFERNAAGHGLQTADIVRTLESAEEPSEVRYRAALALAAAYEMVKTLEQRRGRTALIYVSNGYVLDVLPIERNTVDEVRAFAAPAIKVTAAQLRDRFWALTIAARRAHVRIFAVDPRTVPGARIGSADVSPAASENYWSTTQNTLRTISEETGGFAVLDAHDAIGALKRIREAAASMPVKP